MIRVVIFDLSGTHKLNREPLPDALKGVSAIAGFSTQNGAPIEYCLVSDFHLANPFEPVLHVSAWRSVKKDARVAELNKTKESGRR